MEEVEIRFGLSVDQDGKLQDCAFMIIPKTHPAHPDYGKEVKITLGKPSDIE